jgi:hypothetical protein
VNLLAEGDDLAGALANVGLSVGLGLAAGTAGWLLG